MKKCAKNKLHRAGKRGMTLVEVVVSLAMMVLLFAAFAVYMQGASTLNRRTITLDASLAQAEEAVLAGAFTHSTAQLTIDGVSHTGLDVTLYTGTDTYGNITLMRFE